MKVSYLKNRLAKAFLVIGVSAIALSGCQKGAQDTSKKDDGKIKVYASFYPMYDFASKIGGDKIDIKQLVPTGTEPHDWEPSSKDLVDITKADMLIYNGAGMEHWVEDVANSANNENLMLVEASKGVDLIKSTSEHEDHDDIHDEDHDKHDENSHDRDHDDKNDKDSDDVKDGDHDKKDKHEHNDKDNHEKDEDNDVHEDKEHEHEHGDFDPHTWASPKNARIEAKNIKDALVKADEKNKDYYEENFKKLDDDLKALDESFSSELSKLSNKTVVVQHEAYGYMMRDYGLKQKGIQGLSPDSEPDPSRMKEIVNFAKANNVKVIFFEELISPKVAETIAREVGAETKVLNPVEGLTKEQIDKGDDYISVMKQNLEELKNALK